MSLQPLRCKVCSLLLKEPDIIIGEDPQIRQSHGIVAILQHFDGSLQKESQDQNPATKKPHLQAMQSAILPAMISAQTWLKMGLFDLPDYLQQARDHSRHQINAATRKRSMSDEDLDKLATALNTSAIGLRNLRDYYEERGQYAPAAPKQAEVVKL